MAGKGVVVDVHDKVRDQSINQNIGQFLGASEAPVQCFNRPST